MLDATLRLFDPYVIPDEIASRKRWPRRTDYFARGELTRSGSTGCAQARSDIAEAYLYLMKTASAPVRPLLSTAVRCRHRNLITASRAPRDG
jgi:hypothetical protein